MTTELGPITETEESVVRVFRALSRHGLTMEHAVQAMVVRVAGEGDEDEPPRRKPVRKLPKGWRVVGA